MFTAFHTKIVGMLSSSWLLQYIQYSYSIFTVLTWHTGNTVFFLVWALERLSTYPCLGERQSVGRKDPVSGLSRPSRSLGWQRDCPRDLNRRHPPPCPPRRQPVLAWQRDRSLLLTGFYSCQVPGTDWWCMGRQALSWTPVGLGARQKAGHVHIFLPDSWPLVWSQLQACVVFS